MNAAPQVISMTRTCYASPLNCSGSMDKVVRRNLEGFLPKNAAERCNGTGDIAVTLFGAGPKRGARAHARVQLRARSGGRPGRGAGGEHA